MTFFLDQLLNGLSLGSLYALIAVGYTVVYGIVQLINFAHGEIFMIGAFGALSTWTLLGWVTGGSTAWWNLPLMLIGGFVAGALWALTPALMKVKLAIDEVVTTLLLNAVALFGVSALLNGPWRNPVSQWPQSPDIAASAIFPKLVARSRLHLGFLLAIVIILLLWYILTQTTLGLRMRAVGLGPEAARFAGIHVERTMLISALVSSEVSPSHLAFSPAPSMPVMRRTDSIWRWPLVRR